MRIVLITWKSGKIEFLLIKNSEDLDRAFEFCVDQFDWIDEMQIIHEVESTDKKTESTSDINKEVKVWGSFDEVKR